jgi:ribosome biogenesis protein Nip4
MSSKQQHDVFHLATKKQLQHIRDGLSQISSQIWSALAEESVNIYIRYEKNAEIYLVPNQLERYLHLIKDSKTIQHTGIYFGFFKRTEFLLSLEGAEYLYSEFFEKNLIKLKTITVTEEAAKSFLYGNMLKPEDFMQSPKNLNRKDVIFVLNHLHQLIGIGYIYKRNDRVELRNLVDYGYYIRRGH